MIKTSAILIWSHIFDPALQDDLLTESMEGKQQQLRHNQPHWEKRQSVVAYFFVVMKRKLNDFGRELVYHWPESSSGLHMCVLPTHLEHEEQKVCRLREAQGIKVISCV